MFKFILKAIGWVFGLFARWKVYMSNKSRQHRKGYKKLKKGLKKKDPTKVTMGIDRINNA